MIHVAIDARLPDKGQGGVQQVIRSLAEGFRLIENSDIKRSWIVYKGTEWWEGVFPQEDNLIVINPPFGKISIFVANKAPRLLSLVYPILSKFKSQKTPFDDQFHALQIDAVHLPFQDGFKTTLPYLYQPHDLQHEYFPEYFSKAQIKHRNSVWKKLALDASTVIAATSLVKDDLIRLWNIPRTMVRVIPSPPPTRTFTTNIFNPFRELSYCIYPAVFWPHKNHATLVHAMKLLASSNPDFKCVLAGSSGKNQASIRKLVNKLGLADTVYFVGHVSESQYGTILRDSKIVVIPSQFEALSLTVTDAIMLGKPIVCSDLPAFRLYEAKGMTYFDHRDPNDLAKKLHILLSADSQSDDWSSEIYSQQSKLNLINYAKSFEESYLQVLTPKGNSSS